MTQDFIRIKETIYLHEAVIEKQLLETRASQWYEIMPQANNSPVSK